MSELENKCFDAYEYDEDVRGHNWCLAHSRGHRETECKFYARDISSGLFCCMWWDGHLKCNNPDAIADKDVMEALENI